ncbi:MAG TPA: homogentisate 1,2-dioxygenase [Polyangiaceae bacterium]|nr:homogentisate 1,2-dioxygenase [Polyangiaceae bacterium]
MLERLQQGRVPAKPHTVFHSDSGGLLYEECVTRGGFEGAYTIVYHQHRPHAARAIPAPCQFRVPRAEPERALLRRHYRCGEVSRAGEHSTLDGRVPLLFSRELVLGFVQPTQDDRVYFVNADGDELFYVHEGSGQLRSPQGDLTFNQGDYVLVPKGTLYRVLLGASDRHALLWLESHVDFGIPPTFKNGAGQLRMDAPYSHRDFRTPEFKGPNDEGLRDVVVKRGSRFFGFRFEHSPLDLVGWDGAVYPVVLPILAFQPRVGQIHLPPTAHMTFQSRSLIVSSFVPRPLDFHESANPCPYPHSSVDVDEVLFYSAGSFLSRRGIGAGSLSHHPAGIPHGPHPGAYESGPTKRSTDELAVMLDSSLPLEATPEAVSIEDAAYHESF